MEINNNIPIIHLKPLRILDGFGGVYLYLVRFFLVIVCEEEIYFKKQTLQYVLVLR